MKNISKMILVIFIIFLPIISFCQNVIIGKHKYCADIYVDNSVKFVDAIFKEYLKEKGIFPMQQNLKDTIGQAHYIEVILNDSLNLVDIVYYSDNPNNNFFSKVKPFFYKLNYIKTNILKEIPYYTKPFPDFLNLSNFNIDEWFKVNPLGVIRNNEKCHFHSVCFKFTI